MLVNFENDRNVYIKFYVKMIYKYENKTPIFIRKSITIFLLVH